MMPPVGVTTGMPEVGVGTLQTGVPEATSAATVTLTGLAVTEVVPITVRSKVFVTTFPSVLAGTVMPSVPVEHGIVAGSPGMSGLDENRQLVAFVT